MSGLKLYDFFTGAINVFRPESRVNWIFDVMRRVSEITYVFLQYAGLLR